MARMIKSKKPLAPVEPKLMTIEQWAEPKYKKIVKMDLKKSESLTDMVRRACLALGESDPDNVVIEDPGTSYYGGSSPTCSVLPITEDLQRQYNLHVIAHQKKLEQFHKEQQLYRQQLEEWKQQMISKIKGM